MAAACRAETRSQGIATSNPLAGLVTGGPHLQSRDPFSGDCDSDATRSDARQPRLGPCRAETRSQGIATPSLGDANHPRCEKSCRAETRSQGIATYFTPSPPPGSTDNNLAEPRPVLRGLRRRHGRRRWRSRWNPLAEPRPVLRGLRPWDEPLSIRTLCGGTCRAETRSQGIATKMREPARSLLASSACRAETRSQGIATSRRGGCGCGRRGFPRLQSRDPFSGDCDESRKATIPRGPRTLAEPRPVLRGLRPAPGVCAAARGRRPPLAEPRPVLRGLRLYSGCRVLLSIARLAEPRPVLRGLRL